MDISYDYRDLFKTLNKHKVRYLVVGAYAVGYYTEPRFTKDLDIWVDPSQKNAQGLYKALREFGAPLKKIRVEDFTTPNLFYQIGISPIRVDILTSLGDIRFSQAWKNRKRTKYSRASINVLGRRELIASKKSSGRRQDILDLDKLKRYYT